MNASAKHATEIYGCPRCGSQEFYVRGVVVSMNPFRVTPCTHPWHEPIDQVE